MTDTTALRDQVVETIRTVDPQLKEVGIQDTTSLADLKLDSLRLVELGVLLEERFGAAVRFDEWLEQERARSESAYTLHSLVTFISREAV